MAGLAGRRHRPATGRADAGSGVTARARVSGYLPASTRQHSMHVSFVIHAISSGMHWSSSVPTSTPHNARTTSPGSERRASRSKACRPLDTGYQRPTFAPSLNIALTSRSRLPTTRKVCPPR